MNRVKETTITVNTESNQSCQVSVTAGRGLPKNVKQTALQFVMKDPQVRATDSSSSFGPVCGEEDCALCVFVKQQRLVESAKANIDAAPESDACTDPILISFFETHPDYNEFCFTQARMERYLGKAVKIDVSKKDQKGISRTTKETVWWVKQVVTLNEAAISWCATLRCFMCMH